MGTTNFMPRCAGVAVLLALFGCTPSFNAAAVPPSEATSTLRTSAPVFRAFTVGSTPGLPVTAVPRDIEAGPGGAMWFTDLNTPAIGTISPSLKIHEYTTGLATGAQPFSIVAGPDGNMWFTDGA